VNLKEYLEEFIVKLHKILVLVGVVLISAALFMGCHPEEQTGEYIIDAEDAITLLQAENTVLVDTQGSSEYKEAHCTGAVNISRANIVVNKPYPNMLAPAKQMEQILSARGISKDSTILIYDNNKNMDAARLWWSLLIYGHDNAKVVSGGFEALKAAGLSVDNKRVAVEPTDYSIETKRSQYVASTGDVKAEVDNPQQDVCIIDTRTTEEFNDGTIPTSVHIDFSRNNFKDGTYKPVRQIRILYDDYNIEPEDTALVFCKTSIRAAQTFLALYNAGYRNVKIYDAAWIGWSADPSLPVQRPSGERVAPTVQDGS
jgi:thiosulfate/3-mercaptopyruvate sulfurtransferase